MPIAIPFSEYIADRAAISKHWLDLIERSPAHLRWYLEHPEDRADTPALRFGRLAHTMVLEPDMIKSRYAIKPENIDRRTKAGKEAWGEFETISRGKEIICRSELDQAEAMRKSIMSHCKAAALLGIGLPEQTAIWDEPETGEKCKARADWLHGSQASVIVDLKTCEDARPKAFTRSIINYRYDVQSAHYTEGFDQTRFVFIAVEKKPPYGVAVYAVDMNILARGQSARLNNIETYSECKSTGIWPGYSDEIQTLELPAWAQEAT